MLTVKNFSCGIIKIYYENCTVVLHCVQWILLTNMWYTSLEWLCSEVFIANQHTEELLLKKPHKFQLYLMFLPFALTYTEDIIIFIEGEKWKFSWASNWDSECLF